MNSEKTDKHGVTLCIKCSGELFRSEMRSFGELLIAPLLFAVPLFTMWVAAVPLQLLTGAG